MHSIVVEKLNIRTIGGDVMNPEKGILFGLMMVSAIFTTSLLMSTAAAAPFQSTAPELESVIARQQQLARSILPNRGTYVPDYSQKYVPHQDNNNRRGLMDEWCPNTAKSYRELFDYAGWGYAPKGKADAATRSIWTYAHMGSCIYEWAQNQLEK